LSSLSLVPVVLRPAALIAMLATASGCVIVQEDHVHRSAPDDTVAAPAGSDSGSAGAGTAAGTVAPMLVEVDTDQTMNADPGEGVGVFVEYGAGGKWHVWWTCDTARTNKPCDVDLTITSANGPIANVDTSALAGGFTATPQPARLEASVRTTTEVHGLRFDTLPGSAITVEASISGLRDGSFLFFVQDGKVRGGFQGLVTNPLQLQGKTP